MSVDETLEVDVLVVGSGPVGATFCREIKERRPQSKLVMVDLGPHLGSRTGIHVRNIRDEKARVHAQVLSQGPSRYRYDAPAVGKAATITTGTEVLLRPGTHLAGPSACALGQSSMASAALSSNVGGMGSHWTCASPRAGGSERTPYLDAATMDSLYERAEQLLHVSTGVYRSSDLGSAINSRLIDALPELASVRQIGRMPLACRTTPDGQLHWVGPEAILGDFADSGFSEDKGFSVLSETLCRLITFESDVVTGAIVEHLPTGKRTKIAAKVVAIAADALRTPQLLWNSGIRPKALGHYLNDQPQVLCAVNFNPSLDDAVDALMNGFEADNGQQPRPSMNAVVGVFWVPFEDRIHPFHGQVMHFDLSPVALSREGEQQNQDHVIGLGWFCAKEIRFEDAVVFSNTAVDHLGMPQMEINYDLTERDHANIEAAKQEQLRVASHLGTIREGFEPRLLPAGSSLHYQGSVRMGDKPEISVCDASSRVWGFANLFVGGNGVIPSATACNPTLTSCAFAVHASKAIAGLLG